MASGFRLEGRAHVEISVSSDPTGVLSILQTHGGQLHALLTRLTLRAGVAEDLLQDLFLKLQNAPGFARAANRRAYAFRAAVHLAFDWRRARRQTEPLPPSVPAVGASPLDRMIEAEEFDLILDAMQGLSELGRDILVLRYLQHQEYGDIAQQVGKTEHQVRGLCSRALGQLRTLLGQAAQKSPRGGTRP
jgi:RNA polymerase sigma factor (sigma-70 family)